MASVCMHRLSTSIKHCIVSEYTSHQTPSERRRQTGETHVGVTRPVTLPLAETVLASSGRAARHRRTQWAGRRKECTDFQHITLNWHQSSEKDKCFGAALSTLGRLWRVRVVKQAWGGPCQNTMCVCVLLCWACVTMIHSWNLSSSQSSDVWHAFSIRKTINTLFFPLVYSSFKASLIVWCALLCRRVSSLPFLPRSLRPLLFPFDDKEPGVRMCDESLFALPPSLLALMPEQQRSPSTGVPHYAFSSSLLFSFPRVHPVSLSLTCVFQWRVWRNIELQKQRNATLEDRPRTCTWRTKMHRAIIRLLRTHERP